MKKSLFSNIFKFALFFVAAAVIVTACKDDDDDDDGGTPVIVLDGYYVHGEATASADLTSDMMMSATKNEVGQVDRPELFEKYIALTANTDFHITQKAGATQTTWGPGADFAEVTEPTGDEPKNAPFWRGTIEASETAFQVPEDGLYHVVFDTEFNKVVVARVKWGVIGAATPGGWTDDTELTEGTFDKEAMSFTATGIEMKLNEFKYRYSGGWKIEIDVTDADENNHVKVNTNYGGAVDNLEPGGSNISVTDPGIYTLNVNWTLENGVTASWEKTGDLDFTDWTDVTFDVFGTGVDSNNPTAVADPSPWGWGYAVSADGAPTVEGDVANGAVFTYTWTNVSLLNADGEGFGFRSYDGTDYNGTVLRYSAIDEASSDMTIVGMTTNGFGDENFNVLADAAVDITLTIDAGNNDAATIVIVANGATAPEFFMVGDGCSAGWDINAPLAMEGTDGVYTLTTTLNGSDGTSIEGIKFVTTIGQWQPQYGMGATEGELAVNDGTGTDPAAIKVSVDGTYQVDVNTNDMTYTITAVTK